VRDALALSRLASIMSRAKTKKTATVVGDPIIDTSDKHIVYCVDLEGKQGHAWEYKDTGEAAIAVMNFELEVATKKREVIRSAVTAWRAANRDKYVGLLRQL
jgi:hypothetical protein